MKILILGATGATGTLTIAAARAAGHDVTVLVRDPSKLRANAALTVRTGDATVLEDVNAAATGQDAIISTLGSGKSRKSDIASVAASVFIAAAQNQKVRRLVVLSAFGVGETLKEGSFGQKLAYHTAMKSIFADKAQADSLIRGSDLVWTLLYPVTLNDKPATSATKLAEKIPMKGMPTVSRADVASALVAVVDDATTFRRTLELAS